MRTDRHIEEIAAAHRPDPRPETAFNELATPGLADAMAYIEHFMVTRGLAADVAGVCEALFESIGYPHPEKTTHMTVSHAALSRIYQRARRAFDAKREQAA